MAKNMNNSVIFLKHPTEFPVPGEHFAVQTRELKADLKENDVLLRNLFISLDPCKYSYSTLSTKKRLT